MLFKFVIISLIFIMSNALGLSDPNIFVPMGCYRDLQAVPRPLPELIYNYRLNNQIDWTNLNKSVIERCAQEARRKNYLYFGVQFYGECWSGPNAHDTYMKDGVSRCCVAGVGRGFANMVYRLVGEEKECENYIILDSANRSGSYNTSNAGELLCDNKFIDVNKWYRFDGEAGNGIADFAIPRKQKCQTLIGGWSSDKHPNVTQGIRPIHACFGPNCEDKSALQVRNCGSFYVYKFSRVPGCPMRYCGNGKKSPSITVQI